jgi:O-antigen/teichoic acid export membrane protein
MASNAISARVPSRIRASLPAVLTAAMQALNSLSNLAITWFLIRQIGVDGFGYYSAYFIIAINAVAVTGAFVVNPLNSVASKLSDRRQAEFLQSASASQIVLTAILALAAALGLGVTAIGGWSVGPVAAAFAYTIAMSCGEYWRRVRFFRREIRQVFAYDVVRYALLAIGLLGVPLLAPDPGATAYTLAIAAAYPAAMALRWLLGDREPKVPFERRRVLAQMRRLARSGKWLAGVAFLKFADGGLVLFLSFLLLGPYEAGLIRLAQTITGLTMPAIQTLEHTVPKLLGDRIRRHGMASAMAYYRRLAVMILAGFAVMYAVLVAISPFALSLMGVKNDGLAVLLVGGFSLIYFLTVLLTLIEFQVRARERASIVTVALTLSACVTAALAYPSMEWLGVIGAVAIIVLTRTLSIVLCAWKAFGRGEAKT